MPAPAKRSIALFALVLAAEVAAARPSSHERRGLSALETSATLEKPDGNVTTRGFFDCMYEHGENGLQVLVSLLLSGVCLHGRYCGLGCSGEVDGVQFKAAPTDELDRACFWHDMCYDGTNSCRDCHCNAQLRATTSQIYENGKAAENCGCAPFENTCSNMIRETGSVYIWVKGKQSENCSSDCPDAPTGDQCGAIVMYETDLTAGDYRDEPVAHWHDCCLLCGNEAECRAWTYTQGRCYLKGDTWTANSVEGVISGYST